MEYLARSNREEAANARALLDKSESLSELLSDLENIAKQENLTIHQLMFSDIEGKCRVSPDFELKMLVLDVDGVMTDGGMYVDSKGNEIKKFNTKDGMAIKFLRKRGVPVAFLSSGLNAEIIAYRAQMLDVEKYWVGKGPKLPVLENWCIEEGISIKSVAYIGDDINDVEVMGKVGFAACPSDSTSSVIKKADLVLESRGGMGAIREFLSLFFTDLE